MKQIFKIMVIALAILCCFPQVGEAKVKKTSKQKTQQTSNTKKQSWNIKSSDELKKRLPNTIWTCRPSNGMWHRIEFKENFALCSIWNPYDKCWSWPKKNPYTVTDEISAVGERYIRVQFIDLEDNRAYNFFNMAFLNGKAYLNHGGSYAEAENKDFKP